MKARSLVLCFGLSACGASMQAPPPAASGVQETEPEPATEAPQLENDSWEELVRYEETLQGELELTSTNCRAARELTHSICELAERVCSTAEQARRVEDAERCEDGRARCASAQERTDARCPD